MSEEAGKKSAQYISDKTQRLSDCWGVVALTERLFRWFGWIKEQQEPEENFGTHFQNKLKLFHLMGRTLKY